MRTLRVLLLAAVALSLVAVPSGARADCSQPTAPYLLELAAEGERSVFVGTVVHDDDVARLAVDEVWSGPDLAPEVAVRTGPDQPPWPASLVLDRASSVDADLQLGQRYLVATHGDFATTEPVKLGETRSLRNYWVGSSFLASLSGRLIQTASARDGGTGGLRTNRSGLAA